jgi:FixJ family two-component response regulator
MSVAVIHVVDDDDDMRVAMSRLLRAEGYEVQLHSSAGAFLLGLPELGGGCVLLDLEMPGPSGLELQDALRRQRLSIPIVFLTGRGDIASGVRAMKAGAVDFLTKPVEPAALLEAVAAALARDQSVRAVQSEATEASRNYALLTARERSVFAHVVAGEPNKKIGRALGITERTVKAHRSQVMAKMRAPSVARLVHLASLLEAAGKD